MKEILHNLNLFYSLDEMSRKPFISPPANILLQATGLSYLSMGVDVSPGLICKLTDAVWDDLEECCYGPWIFSLIGHAGMVGFGHSSRARLPGLEFGLPRLRHLGTYKK